MATIVDSIRERRHVTVGVISDTHDRLPSSAISAFRKVDLIVHAGDIGGEQILTSLKKIAPVIAVCGNMDYGSWSNTLPAATVTRIGGINLYLCHILDESNAQIQDCQVVVYGHTHRPAHHKRNGIVYLNPGSAGDPRHAFPPTVAVLAIDRANITAELVTLSDD
jgi:putative phosphoesterase